MKAVRAIPYHGRLPFACGITSTKASHVDLREIQFKDDLRDGEECN